MVYELVLPYPTSVNSYKKVGRIVKTKTGKLYQTRRNTLHTEKFYFDTYIIHKQTMPKEWDKFARSETIAFEVYIELYPPNALRYDVDNRLKVLLDGLTRAKVIYDDSQIHKLTVVKKEMTPQGQVKVKITPLGEIVGSNIPSESILKGV